MRNCFLFGRGGAVLAPLFLDSVGILDEAGPIYVAHEGRDEASHAQAQHDGGRAPVHPNRHASQSAAHTRTTWRNRAIERWDPGEYGFELRVEIAASIVAEEETSKKKKRAKTLPQPELGSELQCEELPGVERVGLAVQAFAQALAASVR
jgi:hypothetical protein